MKNPVNLIRGLLTAIMIYGLIFLNSTINVRAADVPFFEKISGDVRLSIITTPPFANLRTLLQQIDSKGRIDHQFDGNTIPDGDVAIMFLENWRSAATLFDKDMDQIVKDIHKYDPMVVARTVSGKLHGPNGIFPYIFVLYNYEAIENIPAVCIARDILSIIEDIDDNRPNLEKCGGKE